MWARLHGSPSAHVRRRSKRIELQPCGDTANGLDISHEESFENVGLALVRKPGWFGSGE
jgi:hypothetical protein